MRPDRVEERPYVTEFIARAPRKETDFAIALAFEAPPERCVATSRNVSTTGMLILSPEPRGPGTRLSFDSLPVSGTGEVVWTGAAPGEAVFLGLRFLTLDRVDDDLLPSSLDNEDPERVLWRSRFAGRPRNGPGFTEVVELLLRHRVTLAEIAFVLGQPADSIRLAYSDPSHSTQAQLPEDWRSLIADLARGRGPALDDLAEKLTDW